MPIRVPVTREARIAIGNVRFQASAKLTPTAELGSKSVI